MIFLKKLGRALAISIGLLLILSFIMTILNYFNIIGPTILRILKIIIPFVSLFFGGISLGKRSNAKGYLEGIKLGLIFIILTFLFTFLAFQKSMVWNDIFIYLDILLGSIVGSMMGINMKKSEN